jgi:hypothetical protein
MTPEKEKQVTGAIAMKQLFEKLASGQLPLTALTISPSGQDLSMQVHQASIVRNGQETVLIDKKITLSTNSTPKDKTPTSVASISIPQSGLEPGQIKTIGNASVSSGVRPVKIAIVNGQRKLKAESKSGLFVVAKKTLQRDKGFEYFSFLFGTSGQSEAVDGSGDKHRAHIDLYPDGNGKYIRLSEHNCEIENDMQFDSKTSLVSPQKLRIKSVEHGETIEVTFSSKSSEESELSEINFI